VVEDVSGTQKSMIFRSIFHRFFMFFPNPSRRPFLEGPSAGLYSKVRFWSDLGFPWVPKSTLGGAISPKKSKNGRTAVPDEPPWNRPGATWRPKRPKMIQESIFDGFWSYFGPFWLHFGRFGQIWYGFFMISYVFGRFCLDFANASALNPGQAECA
jgi:hypothetical protein